MYQPKSVDCPKGKEGFGNLRKFGAFFVALFLGSFIVLLWSGTGHPAFAARTVAIDPGHGGHDPGAIGITGYQEKEANLDIGLKVKSTLEAAGYRVIMTRSSDVYVELQKRCDIANEEDAEVFVSIHNNSSTSSQANGTEVFYFPTSASGKTLASYIQEEVSKVVDTRNRGTTDRGGLFVLSHTTMPAALVEGAFLSNREDEARLKDSGFRQRLAQGIANGILRYFGDLNPISGHYVSPNPFSPNGDGVSDVGGFYYELSKKSTVTLKVYNYKGEVKTVTNQASRSAGLNGDGWTGTDNTGHILPDGTYKYVLTADAGASFSVSGTVTIRVAPSLSTVGVTPNPFTPNKDGNQDTTSFNYTLDQPASMTIKIFNYLGEVKTLIGAAQRGAGAHTEGWTGTGNNGVILANGTYRYEIRADNAAGAASAQGLVSVVNPPLTLSALHANPNPVYPRASDAFLKSTAVCYTLNQPASVTITVLDYYGIVRNFLSASQRRAGLSCEGWTGTDNSGRILAPGTYRLSIVAKSATGLSTLAASTVTVR